jgi:hypothetical protein
MFVRRVLLSFLPCCGGEIDACRLLLPIAKGTHPWAQERGDRSLK